VAVCHSAEAPRAGTALGPATLFFGCRAREQDYIYAADLAGFLRSGALSALHVAFSREGADKDYVQHHMARDAAALADLLQARPGPPVNAAPVRAHGRQAPVIHLLSTWPHGWLLLGRTVPPRVTLPPSLAMCACVRHQLQPARRMRCRPRSAARDASACAHLAVLCACNRTVPGHAMLRLSAARAHTSRVHRSERCQCGAQEQGDGHLYVCGDAKHMAKDVQRELASIVAKKRGLSAGEAEAVLSRLAAAGRIQKDIW